MELWNIWQDPHLLHATVVHFPVALGLLGFPLMVVAAFTKMRPGVRLPALVGYVLLAGVAFAATSTGLALKVPTAPPDVVETVELHLMAARLVWVAAAVTALLIALSGVRAEWWRAMFAVLAVIGSATTAALVLAAAFFGQTLVYHHGVGSKLKAEVPKPAVARPFNVPSAPVPGASQATSPAVAAPVEPVQLDSVVPPPQGITDAAPLNGSVAPPANGSVAPSGAAAKVPPGAMRRLDKGPVEPESAVVKTAKSWWRSAAAMGRKAKRAVARYFPGEETAPAKPVS